MGWAMYKLKKLSIAGLWLLAVTRASHAADSGSGLNLSAGSGGLLQNSKPGLWDGGIGQGFFSSAQEFEIAAGTGPGLKILGGRQAHDLALLSLSYGHILGHTVGQDHFYRGNWELRLELFGGAQYNPTSEWLAGLTPHLRYNFATGTRFIPYFDLGAGVSATSIGPPDLSNTFEFNLQANFGVRWFLRDDLALTANARFLHVSDASISSPNLGVNALIGFVGLSYFF